MFRNILAATRNPAESDAAVLSAARIAAYNQASLTLVHVIEPLNDVERNVVRHFETRERIDLDATGSYRQEVKEALSKNYFAIRKTPRIQVVCGQRRRTRERQICLPGCCHHGSERFRKMGRAI
ncbi:MAG: universal stress protein, partial [Desulfobacterales bacterium]